MQGCCAIWLSVTMRGFGVTELLVRRRRLAGIWILLRKSVFTKAIDAKLCTTSLCYNLILVHDVTHTSTFRSTNETHGARLRLMCADSSHIKTHIKAHKARHRPRSAAGQLLLQKVWWVFLGVLDRCYAAGHGIASAAPH
jgi:hypothetical protein